MDHLLRSLTSILALGIATLGAADVSLGQTSCREVRLSAPDSFPFQSFGFAVAVSGDTALVSALNDDDLGTESGSVYVFRFNADESGTWVQTQKLLASDGDRGENFGRAVAIDGDTGLVGATNHLHDGAAGSGSVYVFRYTGTTWFEQQELVASTGTFGDGFGLSVSLSGDLALIGAYLNDDAGASFGASYVFRYDSKSDTWVEEQKLLPPNGGFFFGGSVAIEGDLAVIGEEVHLNDDSTCGSAYVYRFNGSTWVEEQELLPSKDAGVARFGSSVSISGDAILIGARREGFNGAAYVFRFDPEGPPGSRWVEEQKLAASDPGGTDQFGRAVSLDGDTAVIGAWSWSEDSGGPSIGRAFVFQFDGSTWVEQQPLLPEPNPWTNFFGWSVAIDGETAVIGADGEDQGAGAAYVFDLNCPSDCPADLDDSGAVDFGDILAILLAWGNKGGPEDLDGSGFVDIGDLLIVLAAWGPCE